QYHDIYNPPINHFQSIIANARLFKERHGIFPMMDWLKAFEDDGLITIREEINILRTPTAEEIERKKVVDGRSYK
ncbi:MAG: hypothetical protein WBA74_04635, partial [Cyclobacteriaceae bacterium]